MKSRIALLGICTLLGACGIGGRRGSPATENEKSSAKLLISNLKTQNFHKVQQLSSGNQFRYLGTFESKSFPASLAELRTESEIGTLSIEFEDEVYSDQYEGEVMPFIKKRLHEIKTTVYLIRESGSPQLITLAVKNDGSANDLNVQEASITVHSSPLQYCAQIHIPFTVGNNGNALEQNATCDVYGSCGVMIQFTGAYRKGEIATFTQNFAKDKIEAICTEHKTQFLVSETKQNRSVPKVANVHLNEEYSHHVQTLEFDI